MNLEKFKCLKCGKCCTWNGFVKLEEYDIARISNFIKLSEENFINKFTILEPNRKFLILNEEKKDQCIFFDEKLKGCLIYEVRPKQCRNFPYNWQVNDCNGIKKLN